VRSFYAHPAEHNTHFKVKQADLTTGLHRTIKTHQVPLTAATGGKTKSICEDDIKMDQTSLAG
jgi:hypothetical protein